MARRSLAAILAVGLATTASAQPDQVEDVIGEAPSDEAMLTADRHKRMTVPVTIAGEGPFPLPHRYRRAGDCGDAPPGRGSCATS